MIGRTLANHRILEKLGEGGMGEVWKAIDTTLDRAVALKVLPEQLAQAPERLARFEREAKLLASLNHPNIATIHGMYDDDGVHFLTMELAPGQDLAARLQRGPLALDDALELAKQVADALSAAHANGIVHRDLKPANIHVDTGKNNVRVLDFGLAKALTDEADSSSDPSISPTVTSARTIAGVVLGTAAYMSPEQARGKHVDQRSDIWAFGCVLYEMLSGKQAFAGDTASDTIAAVLRAAPDWSALPETTPRPIRRLLRRCLEKEPAQRLHDIADARLEIEDALAGKSDPGTVPVKRAKTSWLPWAITGLLAVITIFAMGRGGSQSQAPATLMSHVAVPVPHGLELRSAALGEMIANISPDGRQIVFTARRIDAIGLYVRSLASHDIIPLLGTENASSPFFSPDGRWVAFFASGRLKKISVQGGTVIDLCAAPSSRGGTWLEDGTILFAPAFNSGLARVSEDGGEVEVITTPDVSKNERTHRWPDPLPNDRGILFTIGTLDKPGNYEDATLAILDLESKAIRTLIEGASFMRYSPTGHLLYSRQRELFAVEFDLERLEITGAPLRVLNDVAGDMTSGAVFIAISKTGTLMHIVHGEQAIHDRPLVWVDRDGIKSETVLESAHTSLVVPSLSPDGTKAVMSIGLGPGDGDVWVFDLTDRRRTRLTFHNSAVAAIWAPDGRRVVYGSTSGGQEGLAWKAADGSGVEQLIARDGGAFAPVPEAWVPNTSLLVYSRAGGTHNDLMVLDVETGEISPVLTGANIHGGASLSPDGKWMAYTSDETGRFEVYVQAFPGPGGKWQISTGGGRGVKWSPLGNELFFTRGNTMFVVPVTIEPGFSPGTPRELFQFDLERGTGPWADFEVSRDATKFLMPEIPRGADPPNVIHLITHFDVTR